MSDPLLTHSANDTPAALLPREEFDTLVLGVLINIGPLSYNAASRIAQHAGCFPQAVTAALYRLLANGEATCTHGTWRAA